MAASPKTVLIVEDNEDNRDIYSTMLKYAGYQVVEATTGPDGLEQARSLKPDLILMDVSVPGMDGWTVTKTLKGDDATKTIPIIAVTAHALASDRARAKEVGSDAYLAKPIEPRAVLAEVNRFLGGPTSESPVTPSA